MEAINGVYYVQSGEIKIAAETYGEGPPLIGSHGLSGNRHVLRRQFRPLEDHFQITVFDQRGHNDSTPLTDHTLYHPDGMVQDMRCVMDHLSIDKSIIEGESMGAATALLFAMKYPERVDKLLLTGPAFGDTPNPSRDGLQTMADELRKYGKEKYMALSTKRMREMWNAPDEVIEAIHFMQSSHEEASFATAVEAVKEWVIFEDLAVISKLTMPVCIIAWPDDPLHPIELAQRMVNLLPEAHLVTISSVEHVFLNHGAIIGETYARFFADYG